MNEKQNDFLDYVVYQIYPRSFYDSNGDERISSLLYG